MTEMRKKLTKLLLQKNVDSGQNLRINSVKKLGPAVHYKRWSKGT